MAFIKKEYRKFTKNKYTSFILGGDVGATNTNFGVFGVKNNFPVLLVSFHFKNKKVKGLHYAINETLELIQKNYKIGITKACLAVAGVLSPDKSYAKMANARWRISKKALLKKSKLKEIMLLNDFEAIGYGVNMLSKNDVVAIKKVKKIPKAPIIIVGAGTGLGKTTLLYNEQNKLYAPIPSEAGHSDFAAQNQMELELINFIKKYKKIKQNVSYEQILSGQGLGNIYLFLKKNKKFKETKYTKEIDKAKEKPQLISKYKKADKTCKATFEIFKAIYARFAKNFALDCLALGGVYIAGGIAPKNRDIFDMGFIKTFENNYKAADILKKTPIYLILNYNAGLLGSGLVGAREFK